MEQQVNSKKIILNNGLYLGLATVALSIIMYVTNMIYDQKLDCRAYQLYLNDCIHRNGYQGL